jgi:hypothetical protein
LKLLGFHYVHWRGEYVLRVVGDRFGPVCRLTPAPRLVAARDQAYSGDLGAAAVPRSPAADSHF